MIHADADGAGRFILTSSAVPSATSTLQEAQRSSAYLPLWNGDGPLVFTHRRAYPMLAGRDIEVDCRRRLGVRSFASSLPPDLGLRTSFGREG
jgi:hypothetical protein